MCVVRTMSEKKQVAKVQRAKGEESFEQIFLALYYRHEFARRNKAVFEAGDGIAAALGMPIDRFRFFDKGGSFLTDEIHEAVENSPSRTKGGRRKALGDYLKEFNVVPMTWDWGETRTFFNRALFESVQSNFDTCYLIFQSLLSFEAYAMSYLDTGRPAIFPAFPLRIGKENQVQIVERLNLGKYRAPAIVDFGARKSALASYRTAFDILEDMRPYLHGAAGEVRPANVKNAAQGKTVTDCEIERLTPKVLDGHIEVIDVRRPWVPGRRDTAILSYYERQKGIEPRTLSLKYGWKDATKFFNPRLERAEPYVEDYRKIV